MTFRTAALVAAGLAIVFSTSSANAGGHYYAAKAATPIAKVFGGGGGAVLTGGAAVVGGLQAGLTVAIVWCANNQPNRNWRRDTWVDGRHDANPIHNPRAEGCVVRGKAKPISTRG